MLVTQAQLPQLSLQSIQNGMVVIHTRTALETVQILSESEEGMPAGARQWSQTRPKPGKVASIVTVAMGRTTPRQAGRQNKDKQPSPLVVKLQIAGAVFVPMLLLGLWLHRQGFW